MGAQTCMPILWQPCQQPAAAPAVLTVSCFREQGAHAVAYALTCNKVSRPHEAPPARARWRSSYSTCESERQLGWPYVWCFV